MQKGSKIKISELNRMRLGMLYHSSDKEIRNLALKGQLLTEEYNRLSVVDEKRKNEILDELLYQRGENTTIKPPFRVDYGANMIVGDNFFVNFDSIFLDVAPIIIGDNVMLGPRVSLLTATHPLSSKVRNKGIEYGKSINIGDNVWIGGSVTINPGVSIGKNSIIASGAIVTKDVPENVVVGGTPAKIIKKIDSEVDSYWEELQQDYCDNTMFKD